jgi:hypothetical protein
MPDEELKILITAEPAKAIAGFNQVSTSMLYLKSRIAEMGNEQYLALAKATPMYGATTKGINENVNALGMSRREWMRTGSEAAYYMQSIVGSSGAAGQAIGRVTGMVTQLGESFMFGGAVGVALGAVSVGISAVAASIQAARKDADTFVAALNGMKKSDDAAGSLARLAGISDTQAKAALDAASKNAAYRDRLIEIGKAAAEARDPLAGLNQAVETAGSSAGMLATVIKAGFVGQITDWMGGSGVDAYNESLKESLGLTDQQIAKQRELREEIMHGADVASRRTSAATHYARQAKQDNAFIMAQWQQQQDAIKANEDAAKKYADAVKQVADAQRSIMRGMVEKALSPTAVTDADKAAAALGKYTDKWDEFRRRVEDVAKGIDPSKYGADFAKMFASLGMSADEAARRFKDFSLFADPKNLKLVDWRAMTADIGNQLLQLVGKANLMKEGFAKAWAGLSQSQRSSLRELGIESAGDAKKALMGAADSGVGGFIAGVTDKAAQMKLKNAGADLVTGVSAGVNDKNTLKTWNSTMDTLIANGVVSFTTKENVAQLMDGGKSIVESISLGVAKNQTILSDALINAVMAAIAEATAAAMSGGQGAGNPTPPPGGATRVPGAAGTVGSGGNVVINYAPAVSLASANEANAALAGAARAAQRDATRRGGQ